ncbi:hypothetical protein SAMN04488581_0564 [Mycolicibacterium neoaurum]|uniref:PPE family protein n=1 Tax=Mycolicibacterium neoaurum TaxID=1795 RepID=A0AAV2WSI0_MYCNE|nr:hypothetical protein [Mycolicibacterium neoaurum]TLH49274.1 hypothetical protein C1S81_24185 [Mycolicibacterium neoaurum]CDQ47069.1 PPE family protein [Mycolicibacterium neoaurum]SDC33184.1 hypothetical protein SAMN04488581_0564 [Mycolicibacterium neoaurum]
MGIQPDVSPYGGQTVTGPAWPNVDENALAAAAAQYDALAAKIGGTVVPQQQGQLVQMGSEWQGPASTAAAGEATSIIGGHEANAAQAAAIAAKLRTMEAAVVQTKMMANMVAQQTQAACMAIQASGSPETQALVQSQIMMGLSQNTATVTANATSMANSIGAPATTPPTGAPAVGPQQVSQADPSQGMQMMGQMAGLVSQLPQMLGQAMGQVTQAPQQLMQTVGQPLQQLTSMLGGGGSGGMGAGGFSPFSAFSNHPLAGGAGAGAGAGMMRAASLPGGGGGSAQTPLMASLVGTPPVSVGPSGANAGAGALGGLAPVAAGAGGGMGGAPMMGQRGAGGGGTKLGLAMPEALEHDLAEDDVDDDW